MKRIVTTTILAALAIATTGCAMTPWTPEEEARFYRRCKGVSSLADPMCAGMDVAPKPKVAVAAKTFKDDFTGPANVYKVRPEDKDAIGGAIWSRD